MSLIRQIGLLLSAVLLLALGGAVGINLLSTRDTLQTQLRLKNSDNAQALALALSQQHGDAQLMDLLLSAQFDTGYYRSIRLRSPEGAVAFERNADGAPARAPAWFARVLPIESTPGVAQVSDGWRALGSVELVSTTAYAYDQLWRDGLRAAMLMLGLGLAAGAMAALVLGRIRRPLEATVQQAHSLVEGRYIQVDEPKVPELRRVAQAMNAMVGRVQQLFESQAAQVEALRQAAHCDPLTGLPHRAHFLDRLNALLQREDGVDGGGLVLVRLAGLGELNLNLGRDATDAALGVIARVMQAYPDRVADCFVGRLNGSDFALCLPSPGVAAETAESVAGALRSSLPALGAGVVVHVGAVELRRGAALGGLLAQADLALARAEARGAFGVEVMGLSGPPPVAGERAWRAQLMSALDGERCRLVSFALIDRHDSLVHLECPLRLQLEQGGPFEVAARWLPMAVRNRLTPAVDLRAVGLALDGIAADGRARAVNLAPASLLDGGFAPHLRHLLQERPQPARSLSVELAESAAVDHFDLLQDAARLLRPLGVRVGLEHAGQRLHRIERLYELGLDYIKLDASVCAGVAASEAAQDFVRSTVALLHALSLQVHAEGVNDAGDAAALWACGIDGITGPWASLRRPA